LKFIGCILIIASTTTMGFYISYLLSEKVRQIQEIQYALQVLEGEIVYSSEPLYNALLLVSKKLREPLKSFFIDMSKDLKEFKADTVYEIFINLFEKYRDKIFLNKEEVEVLAKFFGELGTSDIEGQKKNFNVTIKRLELLEKQAEEKRRKNDKLIKYLGFSFGVIVVVILI